MLCVCVGCTHMCVRVFDLLQQELCIVVSHLTWKLEFKLRPSGREASTLKHWAIFPVPILKNKANKWKKKPKTNPNSYKESAIEGQSDATKADDLNLIFTNTIAEGENSLL